MAFEKLPRQSQEQILQCMKLLLEESSIRDGEFQTRLGIDRKQLLLVINQWPDLDDRNPITFSAISSCLNEVLNGLRISPDMWQQWFFISQEELRLIDEHWDSLRRDSSRDQVD